jgi:photosystem II stability/assembly factor-like uncharacterized protein
MRLHLPLLLGLSTVATAQWSKVDVPTTASLRGLSVINQNVVWASGTGGTVIETIDGGKTWSVIAVPGAEKLDFRGIHAFDEKNALIMSSGPAEQGQARLFRTQDGGQSWQQVFEEKRRGIFFDAIAFWDRRHGIVLSDPIDGHFALFRTEDGGATWKQIPPPALPPSLPNEGAFAASNSCLTVQGEQNVWFATGGAKVARVFRSSDRGKSWSVAETPMHPANASSGIFSLAFSDATKGIAVGGDYAHPDSSELPNVMFTSDGGRSWQVGAGTKPAGMYLSSVAIVVALPPSGRDFVAVGSKGVVGALVVPEMSNEGLNAVAVTGSPSSDLWAVGAKGAMRRAPVVRLTFAP